MRGPSELRQPWRRSLACAPAPPPVGTAPPRFRVRAFPVSPQLLRGSVFSEDPMSRVTAVRRVTVVRGGAVPPRCACGWPRRQEARGEIGVFVCEPFRAPRRPPFRGRGEAGTRAPRTAVGSHPADSESALWGQRTGKAAPGERSRTACPGVGLRSRVRGAPPAGPRTPCSTGRSSLGAGKGVQGAAASAPDRPLWASWIQCRPCLPVKRPEHLFISSVLADPSLSPPWPCLPVHSAASPRAWPSAPRPREQAAPRTRPRRAARGAHPSWRRLRVAVFVPVPTPQCRHSPVSRQVSAGHRGPPPTLVSGLVLGGVPAVSAPYALQAHPPTGSPLGARWGLSRP